MDPPTSGAANGENWSIFRDTLSLAPQPSTRRNKAWDRAPVSAHAPRLAGQKIWKKASSHQNTLAHKQLNEDKENAERVEQELEKRGAGSRKRLRGLGGKENIAKPKWMASDDGGRVEGVEVVAGSPRKLGWDGPDGDALVVPRKRTNTNHLITPRKALRSVELNANLNVGVEIVRGIAAQSPGLQAKGQRIPLNDTEGGGEKEGDEKPRRRKSMRKSRRLTRSDLVEEPAPVLRRESFDFTAGVGDSQAVEADSAPQAEEMSEPLPVEQAPAQETSIEEVSNGVEEPVFGLQQAPITVQVADEINGLEAVSPEEESVSTETATGHSIQDLEENQTTVNEILEHIGEPASVPQQDIVPDLEGDSNAEETIISDINEGILEDSFAVETTVEDPTNQHIEIGEVKEQISNLTESPEPAQPQPTPTQSVELEPITEHHPQTPTKSTPLRPATLPSVELSTSVQNTSPVKSTATPRSKRKTPQRRGTRRSTRNARVSSVQPEETFVPVVQSLEDQGSLMSQDMVSTSTADNSEAQLVESSESDNTVSTNKAEDISEAAERGSKESALSPAEASRQLEQPAEVLVEVQSGDFSGLESPQMAKTLEDVSAQQFEAQHVVSENSIDESLTSVDVYQQEEDISTRLETAVEEPVSEESIAIGNIETSSTVPEEGLVLQPPTLENLPALSEPAAEAISEESAESFELIAPASLTTSDNAPCSPTDEASEELHESSTPNPSTTELTETISENTQSSISEQDDTIMLRAFLTKVKANKAAKAKTSIPKRKRSLPHSPLQIPLETVDATSPSSLKAKDDEFDVSLPGPSPSKRRKLDKPTHEEDMTEPKSIRRSARTRLPVKAAPAAPSFIPVRRLGQDGDSTVTLRHSEEKALAALTKINTRKNKGGAHHPADFLAKKAEEKEDPASRHRALKEVHDEKEKVMKGKAKKKSVVWAEELAQFQDEEGRKAEKEAEKEPEKEKKAILPPKKAEKEKMAAVEKKTPVKVGIRSKMTLGMAANGTPAPKRRVRGRS